MSALELFVFEGERVRVQVFEGSPWWLAIDVARVLGVGRTHDAVRGLDDDEVRADTIRTSAGEREATFISESGLYSLILRSRKPDAKRFRKWVTAEVLPEIRRSGSFSVAPAANTFELPRSYAEALRALATEVERREQTEVERDAARAAAERARGKVAELAPPAGAWEAMAATGRDYSVGEAAKILARDPAIEIGQQRLFAVLKSRGMAYTTRDRNRVLWQPYQSEVDAGRLTLRLGGRWQHPRTLEYEAGPPQLRITAKGLAYLHRKLGGTQPLHLDAEQLSLAPATHT